MVSVQAIISGSIFQSGPGQYVKVRVVAGSRDVIVVPQTAVLENQGGRFVWVVGAENKAAQRQIRVGSWVGPDWVVHEGL